MGRSAGRWRILSAAMTRAPSRPGHADRDHGPETAGLPRHAPARGGGGGAAARGRWRDGLPRRWRPDALRGGCRASAIPRPSSSSATWSLPIGVGLFGHVAATGEAIVAGDYRRDKRFEHSPIADRIVNIANMRSMAAAPLIAEGEVIGALGAYSSKIDDFSEAGVALLRALADHAAAAIANQRLIERLASSQEELARRVDAQRTLGEIAATPGRDPGARRGARLGRRGRAAPHRLGRRTPVADAARWKGASPDGDGRRRRADRRRVAGEPDLPGQRRHQRAGRRQEGGRGHRGLPRRSAHPARVDRPVGRRAPRPARHGLGAAARLGGRGDGHAGRLLRRPPSLHRRRARAAPGTGRPLRDRHRQRQAWSRTCPTRSRASATWSSRRPTWSGRPTRTGTSRSSLRASPS